MKRKIFAWLFLIICCNALSYYACESAITPKHNPISRAKQLENAYQLKFQSKRKMDSKTLEKMHEIDVKSFQKAAKGVYGGGDMLRPRSKAKNGASSLLWKSSTLLSAAFGHVIFGLITFVAYF